jgi:hypothetical protein
MTFTVVAKASARTQILLLSNAGSTADKVFFDLSKGTIDLSASNTANFIGATIRPMAGGYYECTYTYKYDSVQARIYPAVNGTASYQGNGSVAILVWRTQLEASNSHGEYVDTTGTATTLGAPPYKRLGQNLFLWSRHFENVYWGLSNTTITTGATAPDGTLSACKEIETGATGLHDIDVSLTTIALPAVQYTISIYAKAGERSRLEIYKNNSGGNCALGFDLSNGTTFANTLSYAGPLDNFGIVPVTNAPSASKWYRCWITYTKTDGASACGFALNNGSTYSYTGNGTSGLYLWNAQLEVSSVPGDPIETTNVVAS